MDLRFQAGGLDVRAHAGAVWVVGGGEGVLFEAPSGVERWLAHEQGLRGLRGVVLSGGGLRSIGGLLPLLGAVEPRGDDAIDVWAPMGEERPGWVLEAWVRGWPDGVVVASEVGAPGQRFDCGPFVIETFGIHRREGVGPSARDVPAAAFRLHFGRVVVAIVPETVGGAVVSRVCRGADLAVIAAGTLGVAEAVRAGAGAGEVWVVGPDGELLGGEAM